MLINTDNPQQVKKMKQLQPYLKDYCIISNKRFQ